MVDKIWFKSNKIIFDEDDKIVFHDECPCDCDFCNPCDTPSTLTCDVNWTWCPCAYFSGSSPYTYGEWTGSGNTLSSVTLTQNVSEPCKWEYTSTYSTLYQWTDYEDNVAECTGDATDRQVTSEACSSAVCPNPRKGRVLITLEKTSMTTFTLTVQVQVEADADPGCCDGSQFTDDVFYDVMTVTSGICNAASGTNDYVVGSCIDNGGSTMGHSGTCTIY